MYYDFSDPNWLTGGVAGITPAAVAQADPGQLYAYPGTYTPVAEPVQVSTEFGTVFTLPSTPEAPTYSPGWSIPSDNFYALSPGVVANPVTPVMVPSDPMAEPVFNMPTGTPVNKGLLSNWKLADADMLLWAIILLSKRR